MVEGQRRFILHGPKSTQRLAAKLRREMTLPEILLWRVLQERPGGLKFRKQHPAGEYALDFSCAKRHLAIEVGGEAHARGDRPARDAARDAWLTAQGVRVSRMPAKNVLADLEAVVTHVLTTARGAPSRLYPSVALRALPPFQGGD